MSRWIDISDSMWSNKGGGIYYHIVYTNLLRDAGNWSLFVLDDNKNRVYL